MPLTQRLLFRQNVIKTFLSVGTQPDHRPKSEIRTSGILLDLAAHQWRQRAILLKSTFDVPGPSCVTIKFDTRPIHASNRRFPHCPGRRGYAPVFVSPLPKGPAESIDGLPNALGVVDDSEKRNVHWLRQHMAQACQSFARLRDGHRARVGLRFMFLRQSKCAHRLEENKRQTQEYAYSFFCERPADMRIRLVGVRECNDLPP